MTCLQYVQILIDCRLNRTVFALDTSTADVEL